MSLRPLGLQDDLDAYNEANPVWPGAEFIRERHRSMPPGSHSVMIGAVAAGRPAGFLMVIGLPIRPGGRGFGLLHVNPWARRRGTGGLLLSELRQAVSRLELPGVVMAAPEEPAALAALDSWGLPVTGRHYESELDLTALADDLVAEAVQRAAGVELRLLGADPGGLGDGTMVDDARLREVYPFFVARFREAPDSAGSTADMPFEIFCGFVGSPWRVLLALVDGELVGVTGVAPRSADTVDTFFTGVHPAHRGRGIALALKARHAQLLRDRGMRRVVTQNMEGNAPILAANDRLGFRRVSAYLDVVVDVSG